MTMTKHQLSQFKFYFTGLITLTIGSLLIWQHLTEGVPSHYLLHRADLPAISNWWGALLLPVLSWLSLDRIHKRILTQSHVDTANYPANIILGFVCSLVYGAIVSASFAMGFPDVAGVMFFGILFFSLFFKVYREQYLLGFIIGMAYVFGAVLPTIFAVVIACASALIYHFCRFVGSKFNEWFMQTKTAK